MSGGLIDIAVLSTNRRREFFYNDETLYRGLFGTAVGVTFIALQIWPTIGAIALFCGLTNISAYMREGNIFLQTCFFGRKVVHCGFWVIVDMAILGALVRTRTVDPSSWLGAYLKLAVAASSSLVGTDCLILATMKKRGNEPGPQVV